MFGAKVFLPMDGDNPDRLSIQGGFVSRYWHVRERQTCGTCKNAPEHLRQRLGIEAGPVCLVDQRSAEDIIVPPPASGSLGAKAAFHAINVLREPEAALVLISRQSAL